MREDIDNMIAIEDVVHVNATSFPIEFERMNPNAIVGALKTNNAAVCVEILPNYE